MMAKRGGLGKGLDALFVDNSTLEEEQGVQMLRLSEIEPNRNQPRKEFDREALQQLADSIREHGVLQPLLVRTIGESNYQLVAGERRWRAARMAGISEVPVIVKELDDTQAMEREDLNPIEEALGDQVLTEQYGMTQEEVAKRVGKSRPAVANALRLLGLPEPILEMVKHGEISSGHARALLAFESEQEMLAVAEKIISHGLTVRDVERLAKPKKEVEEEPKLSDSYFKEVEVSLVNTLGRKIKVSEKKGGRGVVQIEFFNKEDLAGIANLLAGEQHRKDE
mgnify:CR=1 FL=1